MPTLVQNANVVLGSTAFTPAALPGVAAWWSGADLPAPGSPVASWTDRVGELPLTPVAAAPLVSTTAINGNLGVAFDGTALLTAATAGVLPTVAPFTCFVLVRTVSDPTGTNYAPVFEVSSSGANGWAAGRKGSTIPLCLTAIGQVDHLSARYGWGSPAFGWWSFTMNANGSATFHHTNLAPANEQIGTLGPVAGAARITMGGSQSLGANSVGDIYELVICTGALTVADHRNFARWFTDTYSPQTSPIPRYPGFGYNAPAAVATPSNGKTTCVELGVLDSGGSAYNGQRYINGFVPLDSGSQANENPSINFSNDGNTWNETGVTNPVSPYPGGGVNGNQADPCILDNTARDGKMYLYYLRENTTPNSNAGVYYRTSTDTGVTWSAETHLLVQTLGGISKDQFLEPKVVYDAASGNYWLWYLDLSNGNPTQGMYRRVSATPTGFAASADVACTFNWPGGSSATTLPNGTALWHLGIPARISGKWVTGVSDQFIGSGAVNGSPLRNMWIISTTDGLTWACSRWPLITHSQTGSWDCYAMYRAQFVDNGNGVDMTCWYTADSDSNEHAFQMSQKVTIPLTEIP